MIYIKKRIIYIQDKLITGVKQKLHSQTYRSNLGLRA
jgi:hypothetical protein